MAYNRERGLVDLFGGEQDLSDGVVRCVGDPDERFDEDALRILRAVRFSAQLGFSIDFQTEAAIVRHAPRLSLISKERIFAELTKLLCSKTPSRAEKLYEFGLAERISPVLSEADHGRFASLSFHGPERPERKHVRFALLFAGMERERIVRFFRELKADGDTTKAASLLGSLALRPIGESRYEIKKLLQTMTPELFEELTEVKEQLKQTEAYGKCCASEDIDRIRNTFHDLMEKQEPVWLKDLVLTGSDLIRTGTDPGPEIGRILAEMLDEVQREPSHNQKEWLTARFLSSETP